MTIFRTSSLYPDEFTPFLLHFYEFDEVFIALSPFVKMNDDFDSNRTAYQKITLEEAVEHTPILSHIENCLANIYKLNDHYPTDEKISNLGKTYY